MRKAIIPALLSGLLVAACGGNNDSPSFLDQKVALKSVIKVANVGPQPGFDFDLGAVDGQTYYLADRTNKSLDIVDHATNSVVAQVPGFVGQFASNAVSGPNGIEIVGPRIYVGDGDSTVKVIDKATSKVINVIATGGKKRADAIVFDPDDNVVIVTNKNEAVPFISFIDPATMAITGKLSIPSSQLDGALYDPTTKKFLVSVTSTTANPGGEIDVIDPKTKAITAVYPVTECLPGGLALGPSEHLLVACSGDAIDAGFAAKSLILNAATGAVLQTITQVGGSDQATYNPNDKKFYTASRDMTSNGLKTGSPTPVLGVIDAVNMVWLQNVATAKNSKSVAVDAVNNLIYVPLTNSPGPGIGVYGY